MESIRGMSSSKRVEFFHDNLVIMENNGWNAMSSRGGTLLLENHGRFNSDYWGIILWHPKGGRVAVLFDTGQVLFGADSGHEPGGAEFYGYNMLQSMARHNLVRIEHLY